jgi:AbrB family looped-hinge helix DNA binding protein
MLTTRLSSKGQVVLPRLVRTQLRLAPGSKLMCEIRGDSVILTPQSTRGSKEYVTDPVSGLRVSKRKPKAEVVSSDMIRKLLEEFP